METNTPNQTSRNILYQATSLFLVGGMLLAFTSLSLIALGGALFSLYVLNSLLLAFGEGIPVNLVIVFMACLQWIMGPILSYYTGINHPFYGMQVPEQEYFSFVLPGVLLFHLGLMLPVVGVKHLPKGVIQDIGATLATKIRGAYYLIGIGFIASFSMSFVPPALFFVLYLLSQLKFIGCFYLYLSASRNNTILYVVFSTLLLDALAHALFHDLLLWTFFFLFIYCIKKHVSLARKITVLLVSFFLVFVLQSVKYQYRNFAWTNTSLDAYGKSEVFFSMITDRLWSPEKLLDKQANELAITRLNQGWIITRVMNYIPYVEPYAAGETIQNAFSATLVPRFLDQDKAVVAGGRGNMQRFTGIMLQEGTSMNISLIGEGYGNFGKTGAIWFMFLIGIAFSLILRFIILKSRQHPTYILWIPFLFLQVVKAETDLATTLNYLVKATMVMLLVFYTFRKVLKVEI